MILQNKGYEADGNRSTTEHQTNVTVAIDLDCYSAEQKKKKKSSTRSAPTTLAQR